MKTVLKLYFIVKLKFFFCLKTYLRGKLNFLKLQLYIHTQGHMYVAPLKIFVLMLLHIILHSGGVSGKQESNVRELTGHCQL